jgi:hypothetical protein
MLTNMPLVAFSGAGHDRVPAAGHPQELDLQTIGRLNSPAEGSHRGFPSDAAPAPWLEVGSCLRILRLSRSGLRTACIGLCGVEVAAGWRPAECASLRGSATYLPLNSPEKIRSFELARRHLQESEIVTFDELPPRAE